MPLVFSQTKINLGNTCSYYGEKTPSSVYTFTSDNEAATALKLITDASGLSQNFTLLAADIPNAAAVIIYNKRYILYNQTFMYNISNRINYWGSISILAHEVGHHLNGHSLIPGGSRPSLELEADKFSGFILSKLGASLDESQSAINSLASEYGSPTHPPKSARIAAIANGWYGANNSTTRESDNLNSRNFASRPQMLFYGEKEYRQQVFIKKEANGSFTLTAEKGYVFMQSEFEVIDINKNVKLFWFPNYNSYGYVENFEDLPLNRPIPCEGNGPVTIDGHRIPGEYMTIYYPENKFLIIALGKVVKEPIFKKSMEMRAIPEFNADADVWLYYQINNGFKNVSVILSEEDFKKATVMNKIIVRKGLIE